MTKTAWVFPGQGSQKVGMGLDLKETPLGQSRFKQAQEILGWSIPEICSSDEEQLARTLYTQPCLYVISATLADLLLKKGAQPALMAGHSLGEYVALYTAQVFDFATGLKLVKKRAELMDQASDGKMVALIGFDRGQLDEQVQQTPDVVLANDNQPSQVVISGTPTAVDILLDQIKVKRAVELNVSGAFHSPLMAEAAAEFRQVLDGHTFQTAQIPVVSNVEPTPVTDPKSLQERLVRQMTGSVRWRETALLFAEQGIEQVVEVGPNKVLTGLIKRTSPSIALVNMSTVADVSA